MNAQSPTAPPLARVVADDLGGTLLAGRFHVSGPRDEGAMGRVLTAEGLPQRTRVALKILRHEYSDLPDVVSRFVDEGRAAARLQHPNIVRVFEHGMAEHGIAYLSMELLEGVPLHMYTRDGVVPLAHALPIIQQILAGLGHAHAKGVVHRDLKPANIFLARAPNGTTEVKILDFGIAKVMDLASGIGGKTRAGAFLGTPSYMSPEQITRPRDVDARTDLWAAGVLFYRMVTGHPPFAGDSELDRLNAILESPPIPIDQAVPELAPFSGFIARALHKDREQRFQTAAEMASAIAEIAGVPAPRRASGAGPADAGGGSILTTGQPANTTPAPMQPLPATSGQDATVQGGQPAPSILSGPVPLWLTLLIGLGMLAVGLAVGYEFARL